MAEKVKIDDLDLNIIEILREDSSTPLKQIAKSTNSRVSTVHQRINKLKENNIIDFTIKTDDVALREDFIVFMMVQADSFIEEKAFNDTRIKEVFGITGEYDLLLKLKFKDVKEFNDFVLEFRKKYSLKKTLTMVSTTKIKE